MAADRYVQGCSLSPGKVACYTIPESWIIHGRPTRKDRDTPRIVDEEERARRNTGRVISRYWQAVGWLWLRTRSEVIDLGNGRTLKHRQGLLTLTLPGVSEADHRSLKSKVLDPFFTYCRNVLGLRDYVWTAELQPVSGQIHFHALINQFLPKDKVRRAWNDACERSGLLRMHDGNRPSTQVEECRDWQGSRNYAAKYLGKALRSGEIVGRVWSGSHSVTGIGSLSTNECDQLFDVPGALAEIKRAGVKWRQHDHGISTGRYDVSHVTRRRSPILHRLFRDHLRQVDNPSHDHVDTPRSTYRNAPTATPEATVTPQTCDQRSAGGFQVDRPLPISTGRVHHSSRSTGQGVSGARAFHAARKAAEVPDLWSQLCAGGLGGLHPSSVPIGLRQ